MQHTNSLLVSSRALTKEVKIAVDCGGTQYARRLSHEQLRTLIETLQTIDKRFSEESGSAFKPELHIPCTTD